MTQAHGIIARVSNRTPDGSYSDGHDLGEARSLVRSRKGRVGFDARHQQEGRGSVAKGEIRTNQIDRWMMFLQSAFCFFAPRDPDRVCIEFLVSWRKMSAFNPRHRLRSRVNPVRQMSQGRAKSEQKAAAHSLSRYSWGSERWWWWWCWWW